MVTAMNSWNADDGALPGDQHASADNEPLDADVDERDDEQHDGFCYRCGRPTSECAPGTGTYACLGCQ